MSVMTVPLSRFNDACAEWRPVLARLWPDGIPLTRSAAETAARMEMPIGRAARRLLDPAQYREWKRGFNQRQPRQAAFKLLNIMLVPACDKCGDRPWLICDADQVEDLLRKDGWRITSERRVCNFCIAYAMRDVPKFLVEAPARADLQWWER